MGTNAVGTSQTIGVMPPMTKFGVMQLSAIRFRPFYRESGMTKRAEFHTWLKP